MSEEENNIPWWKMIAQSSAAVAALHGLDWRIDTALIDFECPLISPVEVPVSTLNACPSLQSSRQPPGTRLEQTYLSRPWPTAIILLLSPSHARSFLPHQVKSMHGHSQPSHHKLTSSQRWPYTLPSAFDLHQRYPKFSLNDHVNQSTITKKKSYSPVPFTSAEAQ